MKYQIGLVGCGGISSIWKDTISRNPDCRVRYTYDAVPEAAAKRAAEVGAEPAASIEQLLDAEEIDLVIVGTPTFTHADLVVQAARASKHILCEKPMALTLDQCRRMIDACDTAGVKLAIGHTIRFLGPFRTILRLVSEGVIGTPCFGQVHLMGSAEINRVQPEGEPEQTPPSRLPSWYADTRYSGGHMVENLIHELDFARAVFGEVASVYCEVTGKQEYHGLLSPLVIQAMVSFEGGGMATVRQGGIVGFPCKGSYVAGTEGTLSFDDWDGPVSHYRPDVTEPESAGSEDTSAYDLELLDLLQAIENDTDPDNSGPNGMKNLALGLAMYKSLETGRRLGFKDGLPVDVSMDYQYRGPFYVR